MDIIVTATNPKGLDFEYSVDTLEKAKGWAKKIHNRGGVDIKINGNIIPLELIEAL